MRIVSGKCTIKLRSIEALTDTDIETNSLSARTSLRTGNFVCGNRVVVRHESSTVAKPESSKGRENDEGECVAQDPLCFVSRMRLEKVCNLLTSPTPPSTISIPPANKYQPMLAAPFPPAPRHPMSVQLRGVRDNRKPTRALMRLATAIISMNRNDIQWCWVTKGLS